MSILIEFTEKEKGNYPNRLYLCDAYDEALSLRAAGELVIPVYTDNNSHLTFSEFPIVLEKSEELEYNDYLRLWQRLTEQPWTIAETENLIIREFCVGDALDLYKLYSYEDNASIVDEDLSSIDKCESFLKEYTSMMYPFWNYGSYAVVYKDTGRLIGEVGFNNREGLISLELGFALLPEYRGRGFAYEACRKCLDFATKELDLHEFHAFAAEDNIPSIQLLSKLGFIKNDNMYCLRA